MPSKNVVVEWDRAAEVRELMQLGKTSDTLTREAERRIRNLREVLVMFAAMEYCRSKRSRVARS